MSPEERQLLAGLFDRMKSAASTPRDQEAEAFISDQVKAQPASPYLLAQTVIVQDQALQGANQRLQQMEARIRQLETEAKKPSGGFLSGQAASPPPAQRPQGFAQPPQGGPWGQQGGYAPPPPPPPPNYASQGYAPQPPQPGQSGGFLKGALGTAAGVAGGVLLADSIRGLFHGGGGMGGMGNLGIGQGFEPGHDTTVINNYYGDDPSQGGGYEASDPGSDPGYDNSAQDADYGGDGGFDSGFGGDDTYDA